MIVRVLLPIRSRKLFYYEVEDEINIKKGTLVEVNFRGKNKIGIIWEFLNYLDSSIKIKSISKVFYGLRLKNDLLNSIQFFSNYTCASLPLASRLCLTNFSGKLIEKKENYYVPSKINNSNQFKFNYEMTEGQKIAFVELKEKLNKDFGVTLLEGVTNSGKTRVYMNVIIDAIKKDLQCVVLVPEKILTKQWVKELQTDFNLNPEIYHSSISKKKKNEIWLDVLSGKVKIIVGTRSAIFLPFKKLGLIVIDEEHDTSFKQEEGIIINVRDFAVIRAKFSKCLVILSSATPSVETFYNCQLRKYDKIILSDRVKDSLPPKISLIDMRYESKFKNSLISNKLRQEITKTLNNGKQSLIFINKRGYAPVVLCKNCGYTKRCVNCEFSLVLHKKNKAKHKNSDLLLCHYCNYKENFKNFCNNCHSSGSFEAIGPGIEKVFEEIKNTFPHANICLMSSDVINSNTKFEKVLNEILTKKVNIIIGTQITSKGHNFPDLDTVGILNLDTLLNSFDLRSSERAFQLITQISGRAGREKSKGNVLIQTYQPDHPIFQGFKKEKFNFFDWEINQRKQLFNPPFSNLISLIIEGKSEYKTESKSLIIKNLISKKFINLKILGPAPAVLFRLKNIFRWRILIKIVKNSRLQNELKKFLIYIQEEKKLKFKIDVDPQNFF